MNSEQHTIKSAFSEANAYVPNSYNTIENKANKMR